MGGAGELGAPVGIVTPSFTTAASTSGMLIGAAAITVAVRVTLVTRVIPATVAGRQPIALRLRLFHRVPAQGIARPLPMAVPARERCPQPGPVRVHCPHPQPVQAREQARCPPRTGRVLAHDRARTKCAAINGPAHLPQAPRQLRVPTLFRGRLEAVLKVPEETRACRMPGEAVRAANGEIPMRAKSRVPQKFERRDGGVSMKQLRPMAMKVRVFLTL